MYFGLETQGRGVDANGFPPRLRVKENRSFPDARFLLMSDFAELGAVQVDRS
jgi:hypothetical protein